MTDMENENPTDTGFFPVASRGVIENWVNTGGVMVMTGTNNSRDADFLNLIFSWDLVNISTSSSWGKTQVIRQAHLLTQFQQQHYLV